MTITITLMCILAIQLALSVVIYNLNKALTHLLDAMEAQDRINHVNFEATQIIAQRLDLAEKAAADIEGVQHQYNELKTKCDVQEIQILNLNNKTALQSTAIRKLQDSCLEVK